MRRLSAKPTSASDPAALRGRPPGLPDHAYHMTSDHTEPGPVLRALRERTSELGLPLHAVWELTHRCNLRCRHCYLRGKSGDDELDTAEAKDLLGQMARLGVMFVALTGGEPLLRPDLFELVDEARALGFAWKLQTSGTLVDEETARRLAERFPLQVSVSLYGLEATHDSVTSVPGSFRATVGAMNVLAGLGVPVIAKTSLTPQGLPDLPALRALCSGFGVRLYVATIMYPGLDGAPVHRSLKLSEEDLADYFAGVPGKRGDGRGQDFVHEGTPGADEAICNAGRSAFAVSPRGDVRACIFLRQVCGNVRETPLGAIWESEHMIRARRLTFGALSRCRGCGAARFCSFCPGLAEAETGDPLSPPPTACREAWVRQRLWEGRHERPCRRRATAAGNGGRTEAGCELLGPD